MTLSYCYDIPELILELIQGLIYYEIYGKKKIKKKRRSYMNFIFIYITNPTKKEAEKIAVRLLEKGLVACANIFPITSFYWWEGRIKRDGEFILLVKTIENNFEKVKKEVENIHSYKIPCIIKIPVRLNEKYSNWLKGEIKNHKNNLNPR